MLHPVRTLMYELLIEPVVELWQRMRGLPGDPASSSNLTDPLAIPPRSSLLKP